VPRIQKNNVVMQNSFLLKCFPQMLMGSRQHSRLACEMQDEVVPVPRHEDIWGSGGLAPRIRKLGTRRR
jgi:hypothetical protein